MVLGRIYLLLVPLRLLELGVLLRRVHLVRWGLALAIINLRERPLGKLWQMLGLATILNGRQLFLLLLLLCDHIIFLLIFIHLPLLCASQVLLLITSFNMILNKKILLL
jgi:hypothetical protein